MDSIDIVKETTVTIEKKPLTLVRYPYKNDIPAIYLHFLNS